MSYLGAMIGSGGFSGGVASKAWQGRVWGVVGKRSGTQGFSERAWELRLRGREVLFLDPLPACKSEPRFG